LPETAEDIFTLFSPTDIRRVRDNALPNLETLVLATTSKLCELRKNPAFPNLEIGQDRHALNCVRILTRVLPFIYETENLEQWEDKIFWTARSKTNRPSNLDVLFDGAPGGQEPPTAQENGALRPLGEELVDVLVDLLFFSDFTLPTAPAGKSKISYAIWQTGVGCHTPVGSSKVFESNRTEILRLLLVLSGKALYMNASLLPVKGVPALTYLTNCADKQIVLSLLCSLLNTTLKYNPASWRVPYDHVVFRDEKQLLAMYCLQFLLVLVLYPVPEITHGVTPKNYFRHYLGRLHRVQDFQFLVDGMTRILNQPVRS
jgi:High-temperature-induced dauer-formation protein